MKKQYICLLSKRVMVCLLIFMLTCANFLFCGNYFVSYAANKNRENLDKQTEATIHKNVKFDVYFGEDTNKTHYGQYDVNQKDLNMSFMIQVEKEGYLKNASIAIEDENGKQDKNYQISKVEDPSDKIQQQSNSKISLRQIDKEEKINDKIYFTPKLEQPINVQSLNSITKFVLNGTYVDGKGKETEITKDVKLQIGWTGDYTIDAKQELVKYIPLNINGTKKVLVQTSLKVGLQKDQQILLPIQSTTIESKVPSLNGILPEKVVVSAEGTKATNGLEGEKITFDQKNWNYDKNNGNVKIQVENKTDSEQKVAIGEGQDSYLISYTYPASAYDSLQKDGTKLATAVQIQMNLYQAEDTKKIETTLNDTLELKNTTGKIVSLESLTNEEHVGKGKLYVNQNSQTKEETTYQAKWQIDVGYTEHLEGIQMQDEKDEMVDKSGNAYNMTPYILYRQTVVKRETFLQVLGENGSINFYDKNNTLVGIINKDSKTDENGDYVITYLTAVNQLVLQTSAPVSEGNLIITHQKAITGQLPFSKTNLEDMAKIRATASVSQKEDDGKDYLKVDEAKAEVLLDETSTKANLTLNKTALSTIINNENVEMRIELCNDKEESDLYADPIFDIELPSYIEDVQVKEYQVLYDDELVVNDIQKLQNNGKNILRVQLKGIETKFSKGSITNGTNIVLKTDLKVNILTPNKKDTIQMYYYNNGATNYAQPVNTSNGTEGLAQTEIEYAAPTGLVNISHLSNYEDTGKQLMSVNQGSMMDKIGVYQKTKIARMNLILVNNTGHVCDQMSILGRLPFKGNQSVEKEEDLGTTFDTYIHSKITAGTGAPDDKITVYYSENGKANKNLKDSRNGWTTSIQDYQKVKSYLIVLDHYQMQPGDNMNFYYDLEIPANISYNNTMASNFATYYVEQAEEANREEISVADTIGLTTGKGPDLKISQTVSGMSEDKTIGEYQLLKYTVTVKNEGTETARGAVIKSQLPNWTQYVRSSKNTNTSITDVEYYPENADVKTMNEWNVVKNGNYDTGEAPTLGWTIDSIEPGQTITKEVEIMTLKKPDIYSYYKDYPGFTIGEDGKYYISSNKRENNVLTEQKSEITSVPDIDLKNVATVTAKNFAAELQAESDSVKLKPSDFTVNESKDNDNETVEKGDTINFTISVMNKSESEKKNVVIEKTLPEGLDYESSSASVVDENGNNKTVTGSYDSNTRKVTISLDTLASNQGVGAVISTTVGYLNDGEYERNVTTNTKITAENFEPIETNQIQIDIAKPKLDVSFTCDNSNSYLQADEEVTYQTVITNNGKVEANNVEIKQTLPAEVDCEDATYTLLGNEVSTSPNTDNEISIPLSIQSGDTITLQVKVKAKALTEDTNIETDLQIKGDNIDLYVAEPIQQTIEKSQKAIDDQNKNNGNGNNGGDGTITGAKLSGNAWLDANENGKRDDGEQPLKDIQVIAINADTGDTAKDNNGNELKTATDGAGQYTLVGLPNGNYLLAFFYDTNVYTTTVYHAKDAGDALNSDASERTINQNGTQVLAGVTDTIAVDKSQSNIDIGLISKEKFDLKLDKFVSQITVQNKEGTKVHQYGESKLATTAITGKQLKNTTVVIEYKIKVTNEGNVAGYAKNIVDYVPKDLNFNSELNTNWYSGKDGYVYSTQLKDTVIQPGETKEIKLILTKKMNETNTGLINNNAEIQEDYNEKGLKDRDSTAGNQAQGEDDQSSADVLLTVKTGSVAIMTVLILALLVIMGIGIYIIVRIVRVVKR